MGTAQTARYDYFSATADYEPELLVETFARMLDAEPRSRRAFNGYTHAIGIHRADDPEVVIQWTDGGRPNILADGFPSQRIYELTRRHFPNYGLARGDVAVDDLSTFEVAHAAMRTLSHEKSVRHSIIGDWETPGSPSGRTTESGSRSGRRYRRLYEYAKCHGYGPAVRYEFECKPDSKHKHRYVLSPIELLQTDSYSVELLRRLGIAMDRLVIGTTPPVEPHAWFLHLVRQYGQKLTALVSSELDGDYTRLGPHIAQHLELANSRSRQRLTASIPEPLPTPKVATG